MALKRPHAQEVARVPRSRRDDKFGKGTPLPPKRGGIGVVTSIQTDTVTVLMSNEQVPGVIPLGKVPVVGAVVEVEARGDLLVIPPWADVDAVGDIPTTLVTSETPQFTEQEINLGGVDDAAWYFLPDESPGWLDVDAPPDLGTGLHVFQVTNQGLGTLWNVNDFAVRPGEAMTFTMVSDQVLPSEVASARLAINWDAEAEDPQPSTGEVHLYEPVVTVAGSGVVLTATLTVPDTFTRPADVGALTLVPGRARIGVRYVPSSFGPHTLTVETPTTTGVVGSDEWADAPDLPYGYRSASTPSDGLTADAEETAWGAAKTAWWKVTVPADHDPAVTVRVTCLRTYIDAPGDPGDNDNDGEAEMRLFTGDSRDTLEQVDRGADCWDLFDPGAVFYIECHVWDNSEDLARNYVVEVADQTSVYSDWVQGPDVSTGWKNTVPGRTDYRSTSGRLRRGSGTRQRPGLPGRHP
jgi:hypothetical protein